MTASSDSLTTVLMDRLVDLCAIPFSLERDALRRKLGQIAKYADDLDANGGPEDGGSYAYLAVAKALRGILKDNP